MLARVRIPISHVISYFCVHLFTFVQLLFTSDENHTSQNSIPLTDLYASGKYAGKLYFSPNSDKSAMSKALNDNVKGAYRPGRAFPDNEAEAKTLAKQLGMSWGGTGAYKNHGACKLFLST